MPDAFALMPPSSLPRPTLAAGGRAGDGCGVAAHAPAAARLPPPAPGTQTAQLRGAACVTWRSVTAPQVLRPQAMHHTHIAPHLCFAGPLPAALPPALPRDCHYLAESGRGRAHAARRLLPRAVLADSCRRGVTAGGRRRRRGLGRRPPRLASGRGDARERGRHAWRGQQRWETGGIAVPPVVAPDHCCSAGERAVVGGVESYSCCLPCVAGCGARCVRCVARCFIAVTLGAVCHPTQSATAVLCNDKPETFGAPDVLQCSLAQVGGVPVLGCSRSFRQQRTPMRAHARPGLRRWIWRTTWPLCCQTAHPTKQVGATCLPLACALPFVWSAAAPCRLPRIARHPRPARTHPCAGRVSVRSHAAFLNSSTSRWEALWGSWPAQAEFVDIVSPVYLSDRQT